MSSKNIFLFYTISLLLYTNTSQNVKRHCGNDIYIKPKRINKIQKQKRALTTEENYDLNIIIDLKNLEEGIIAYDLLEYNHILINAFNSASKILNSLLKVTSRPCYYIYSNDFDDYGFNNWDKEKYGISSSKNYFITCDYNMDLFILVRFMDSKELIEESEYLLISGLLYIGEKAQPIIGRIILNQNELKSHLNRGNSEEYFKNLFLHHFIHILGFNSMYIQDDYHKCLIKEKDMNGIERKYINSTKVVNIAQKYFNCNDINRVELEELDTIIHWESRILLGEIMTGGIYSPEQVISEFTLAFLEDLGYYKANYFTGGLMQYGRNKGCKFIKEKCVQNGKIDEKYENEFFSFDNIKSINGIDASCSSGRQSRTYFYKTEYSYPIPDYYQYFNNIFYGGYSYADYCPVSLNYHNESYLYIISGNVII